MAPSAGNRHRRSCTRYVVVPGRFGYPASGVASAGSVTFRFTGRINNKALAPGSYRLDAVAAGVAGARSTVARANFRILS